jgi:hypothetical protein
MSDIVFAAIAFVVLALVLWLAVDSDDDNGGGGLMQPALVPIRVRQR